MATKKKAKAKSKAASKKAVKKVVKLKTKKSAVKVAGNGLPRPSSPRRMTLFSRVISPMTVTEIPATLRGMRRENFFGTVNRSS